MMSDEVVKGKRIKGRSIAYPSITIEKAIEFSGKLSSELGKGPYSRFDAARGIGHSQLSGPAARKIAALVHYGLLERSGNVYNQSTLAQEIISPVNEDEKIAAIIKAVRSPKVFSALLQEFGGQSLPMMLGNILIRKGINASVSEEAASIFRESLKFAGMLNNGVVSQYEERVVEPMTEEANDGVAVPDEGISAIGTTNFKDSNGVRMNTFNFPGGIQLIIPSTPAFDEAILDGELKEIRSELKKFSEDHFQSVSNGE